MTNVSKSQHADRRDHQVDAEPSVLETWAEQRTGKRLEELQTTDLLAVPRHEPLRYAPLVSPLGGRLDAHLRHLEADEAADLLNRGDRFLDETPDEPKS